MTPRQLESKVDAFLAERDAHREYLNEGDRYPRTKNEKAAYDRCTERRMAAIYECSKEKK